jgi:hypothetical protein
VYKQKIGNYNPWIRDDDSLVVAYTVRFVDCYVCENNTNYTLYSTLNMNLLENTTEKVIKYYKKYYDPYLDIEANLVNDTSLPLQVSTEKLEKFNFIIHLLISNSINFVQKVH